MSSDAGKLIALSLGKIADSRKQRGGINLCKNLLVSTVLFKARAIYMMENYQQIAEAKKQKKESKCAPKSQVNVCEKKVESLPDKSNSDLLTRTSSDPDTSRIPENNKENITPVDSSSTQTSTGKIEEKMDCIYKEKDSINKTEDKLSEKKDNAQCVKCTKRRRSEVGESGHNDLKSRGDDSGLVKKAKLESPPPSKDNTRENDSRCEPMVTEPPQISNLVQIFNTGFAGLCEQASSKDSYSNQSCVKQVPSFVENLTRPVIALAV